MENMRFRGPASFPLSLWAVIMGTGACMDEVPAADKEYERLTETYRNMEIPPPK